MATRDFTGTLTGEGKTIGPVTGKMELLPVNQSYTGYFCWPDDGQFVVGQNYRLDEKVGFYDLQITEIAPCHPSQVQVKFATTSLP